MGRWLTACGLGILLTMGQCLVAQEEDPFAEVEVPVVVESPVSALDVMPLRHEPVVSLPLIRRPLSSPVPSAAQQKVIERAAQEARHRKARIEQRKSGTKATPQPVFPSEGPLADPALYHIDPGIRVAFRPITLSGLEPLPTPHPKVNGPARTASKRAIVSKSGNAPLK